MRKSSLASMLCVLLILTVPSVVQAGTLNRSAIVNYAYRYWYNYNPNYRSFGNDCQNFVSQALSAGGWTQNTGFYQSTSAWWYGAFTQSYPWTSANYFATFTYNSGRAALTNDPTKLVPGDILQVDWDGNGTIDHSMIVTKKDSSGTVYLTYHSGFKGPVKDKPYWELKYSPNDPHLILYPNIKYYGWRLYTYF